MWQQILGLRDDVKDHNEWSVALLIIGAFLIIGNQIIAYANMNGVYDKWATIDRLRYKNM